MLKWHDLISNKGFVYFLASIIAPFLGCLFLLQEIDDFAYAQEYSINGQTVSPDHDALSMVFFGDAMFDRNVRKLMEREGMDYPLLGITPFVKDHDIGILNLEGVYTDNSSVSVSNNEILQFTFDPLGASYLHKAGFDFASQANNHANDFGRDGAQASIQYLENNGINSIGDFFNESDPVFFEKKGQKVALIGFNEFSYSGSESVKEKIASAKRDGYFAIIFAHFGVEYERFPNSSQKKLARSWIEAGADLVLGSHPHVIEPVEEYKGKLIFYSLGNFIFDQYFSKETQTSIAVSLFLNDKEASIKITPLSLPRSRPAVTGGKDAKIVLEDLADDSEVPKSMKEKIRNGVQISIDR